MAKSPIPILLILLLMKNRGNSRSPLLGSLELESFLDNAHTMLDTLDKVSSISQSGIAENLGSMSAGLPDMKKIMEIVEKLPL